MKKNWKKHTNYKAKNQVKKNTKRAYKAKKRNYPREIVQTPNGAKFVRKPLQEETTRDFKHGPSLVIKYDKNGKVINWNNHSAHIHQQPTKEAKAIMQINKDVQKSKKERIKQILKSMNYDPTIKYTRKEKKHFTRAVKAKLFEQPKPITVLTKEQYKEKFKQEKIIKQAKLANLPHIHDLYTTLPNIKGLQRSKPAAEMNVKEKGNNRKFTYVINRVQEEDLEAKKEGRPYRSYEFLTDYFNANTVKEAERKIKSIAKKYKEDTSFAGITLKDPEGENMMTYYSIEKLNKIAA